MVLLALVVLKSNILFFDTLAVDAVNILIPLMVETAVEVDNPLITLLEILNVVTEADPPEIPNNVPPEDDNADIVFPEQLCIVAELPLPSVIPVRAAAALMFDMILSFTVLLFPPRSD